MITHSGLKPDPAGWSSSGNCTSSPWVTLSTTGALLDVRPWLSVTSTSSRLSPKMRLGMGRVKASRLSMGMSPAAALLTSRRAAVTSRAWPSSQLTAADSCSSTGSSRLGTVMARLSRARLMVTLGAAVEMVTSATARVSRLFSRLSSTGKVPLAGSGTV